MSATSYICSYLASRLPVEQRTLHEPTGYGGACSSVCAYQYNEQCGINIVQNAHRIIQFFTEVLRIILSSSRTIGFQMPESGDVEVLNPNVSRVVGVPARRRVGLSLDFSDISPDDLVTKRCKIESMNIQISNGPYPHNGGSGVFHRTMLPSDLACRINKSKVVLVIDCRPFFAYNANHIQGAVNINCSDRFNRRRLLQGKCSLGDLVTSKDGKDLYKKRSTKEVVLYDDRTKDVKDMATDGSMYIILSVLRREGKQASILKGNYHNHLSIYVWLS